MSKNNPNVHVYADSNYAVWTAPIGTTVPTSLPPAVPASYFECGLLSDAGITEAHNLNETKIYDLAGSLVRIARNQEERPWTFECLEENAVESGLRYPGSTLTTTGATADVDTVSVTGTPTGGTFVLTGGIGSTGATGPIVYNATNTAIQAAVRTLPGLSTVTVAGTSPGPFTVTGPASGQAMNLGKDASNLTGGTTPNVTIANSTPGVVGKNSRPVGAGTGRFLRQFAIDIVDGTMHKRILINNGEATWTGTKTFSGGAASIAQFTLQPYKDASGNYYTIIDDDPAQAGSFS